MEFVKYLREYCKRRYITAYELSKITDVSRSYCYALLNGKMENPSIKIIRQISRALKIEYESFINTDEQFY